MSSGKGRQKGGGSHRRIFPWGLEQKFDGMVLAEVFSLFATCFPESGGRVFFNN